VGEGKGKDLVPGWDGKGNQEVLTKGNDKVATRKLYSVDLVIERYLVVGLGMLDHGVHGWV